MKALITGASSGIGEQFARIIASEGHEVILVARDKEKLSKLAKELKGSFVVADLSTHEGIKKITKLKGVDILINNAGFGLHGEFRNTSIDTELNMIHLNIVAVTVLSKWFLQQNGKMLLNVASISSFLPGPMMAVYFATKAYVLSFTEGIAEENLDVHITALCPGPTESKFSERGGMGSSKGQDSAYDVALLGWNALKKKKRYALARMTKKVVFFSRFLSRKRLAKGVKKRLS